MQHPIDVPAQTGGARVRTRARALRTVGHAALALTIVSAVLPLTPTLAASLPSAPTTSVINQPPKPAAPGATLSVFPSRDFVTTIAPAANVSGYPTGNYTVNVLRNGVVIGSASASEPDLGVNHPGGSCWDIQTPDIRPGDVLRITDLNGGVANQTTVQNLTTQAPTVDAQGNLVIHGTAASAGGNPVAVGAPLPGSQVESRILAPKTTLFSTGKRDIRAGGAGKDGTLSFDPIDPVTNPTGTNWTAVYRVRSQGGLLTSADVQLALDPGAQPRVHWLGSDPASLTESTIWELPGAGRGIVKGPQAPCVAPAQTGPTLALSPSPGPYRTAQSITITSSDPAALINFTTDGTTPASTGGTVGPVTASITGTATLRALANNPTTGSLSQLASGAYVIDAIAPTATIALSGTSVASGLYRSGVSATISATDAGGAGLATLRYSLDGGPATDIASGASLSIVGDGSHTLSATATDQAGNVSATASQTFAIDTVAPAATLTLSGTAGAANAYRSAVTATITATDNAGGSGVAAYGFGLDGAKPTIGTSNTLSVGTPGSHQVTAFAVDAAGNTSSPVLVSFVIDTTAPVPSITVGGTPPASVYSASVNATISAADEAGGSGLASLVYSLDGGSAATVANGGTVVVSGDGPHTLTATAADQAGNSASTNQAFVIDSTPPRLVVSPAGGTFTSTQTVALQAVDASSTTIYYTLDGTQPTVSSAVFSSPIAVDHSLTLRTMARDAAGNKSERTDVYTIGVQATTSDAQATGVQTAVGGPQASTGGVQTSTGGAQPSTGGAQTSTGGGGGGGSHGGSSRASTSTSPGSGAGVGSGVGGNAAAPVSDDRAASAVHEASPVVSVAEERDNETHPVLPVEDATTAATVRQSADVATDTATLVVDPVVGGTLTTIDGTLWISVPTGASVEPVTVSLTHLLDSDERQGNLFVGKQRFLVSVATGTGAPVSTFDQPLTITTQPSADDVAAANGDLSSLSVMALNPDSGLFEPVSTIVNADGTVTGILDRLAALAVPSNTAPDQSAAVTNQDNQSAPGVQLPAPVEDGQDVDSSATDWPIESLEDTLAS